MKHLSYGIKVPPKNGLYMGARASVCVCLCVVNIYLCMCSFEKALLPKNSTTDEWKICLNWGECFWADMSFSTHPIRHQSQKWWTSIWLWLKFNLWQHIHQFSYSVYSLSPIPLYAHSLHSLVHPHPITGWNGCNYRIRIKTGVKCLQASTKTPHIIVCERKQMATMNWNRV